MSNPACGHDKPTYGCETCINTERTDTLWDAVKDTPAPPCPECGGPTAYYESNAAAMTLSFTCTKGFDEDGQAICDGDVEVKIR